MNIAKLIWTPVLKNIGKRLPLHRQNFWSSLVSVRSSPLEVSLGKGVLKICSKFTGQHPVNLLHIFRTPFLNRIQDGFFRGCSRMGYEGVAKKALKSVTRPTLMKLGAVILYLKKIEKIHKSRDTPLDFCRHQHFFTENQQFLVYQEIQYRLHFNA